MTTDDALIEKMAEIIWIADGISRDHSGWLQAHTRGVLSVERALQTARAALAVVQAERAAEVEALVEKLSACDGTDPEADHAEADRLLLAFIADGDIERAYLVIPKWYA